MKPGKEKAERLLYTILDMGEMLLTSGAEIKRVEDTLTRMEGRTGLWNAMCLLLPPALWRRWSFRAGYGSTVSAGYPARRRMISVGWRRSII